MGRSQGTRCGIAESDGVNESGRQRRFAPAAKLGEEFGEAIRTVGFRGNVEDWRLERGIGEEDARQLETGITGDADNRVPWRGFLISPGLRFFPANLRAFLLGVMIRTVSSPAMVPAISGNLAPSDQQRPGAAPRWEAFSKTRRFSAGRISREIRRGREQAEQRRGFFSKRVAACSLPEF